MKTYELIEAAADLIKTTGWTRRAMSRDSTGKPEAISSMFVPYKKSKTYKPVCFCAMGAAIQIAESLNDTNETNPLIEALCALHAAAPTKNIAAYNDAVGRTKEEILEFMLRAAAKLRAKDNSIIL